MTPTERLAAASAAAEAMAGRAVTVRETTNGEIAYGRSGTIWLHRRVLEAPDPVLAGTLAHEVAHQVNRDGLRLTIQQAATLVGAVAVAVGALLTLSWPGAVAVAVLAGIGGRLAGAAYERRRERAADRRAVELLTATGRRDAVDAVAGALAWGAARAQHPSGRIVNPRRLPDLVWERWRALDHSHGDTAGRIRAIDRDRVRT